MNKTIACCLVGLILAIAIEAIYLEWVPPSPPGFTEHQYNREEAAGPKPPVLASERTLEQAAAIPSSPSRVCQSAEMTATVAIGDSEYAISREPDAGGVMKVDRRDGEGSFTTRGTIKDGRRYRSFTFKISAIPRTSRCDKELSIARSVTVLAATRAAESGRRANAAFSRNSRSAIPQLTFAAAAGETVDRQEVTATLPIFAGHQRYDLDSSHSSRIGTR